MRLLLLNYPYLQSELIQLGHQVTSVGPYQECSLTFHSSNISDLQKIVDLNSFEAVIFADGLDTHRIYSGLDQIGVTTVYISIDSTINFFWQSHYAQCFDLVFQDQIADVLNLAAKRPNCYTLPLACSNTFLKSSLTLKKYDISFAGRLHDQNRIKRSNILNLLRQHNFQLNLIDGQSRNLTPLQLAEEYAASKIVLNENLFPGINLRLFEIMGSGSLAFTEDSCPFLSYYFTDKQHLVTYNSTNLIQRLKYYLEHDSERELIAKKGNEEIRRQHKDLDRAKFVIGKIRERPTFKAKRPLYEAATWLHLGLKYPDVLLADYAVAEENHKKLSDLELPRFLELCYLKGEHRILKEQLQNMTDFSNPELLRLAFWLAIEFGLLELWQRVTFAMQIVLPLPNLNDGQPYFLMGEYLRKQKPITFGLTTTRIAPCFYSSFDCFSKCLDLNYEVKLSLTQLSSILAQGQAWDYAAIFMERLVKLNPDDSSCLALLEEYRVRAYILKPK